MRMIIKKILNTSLRQPWVLDSMKQDLTRGCNRHESHLLQEDNYCLWCHQFCLHGGGRGSRGKNAMLILKFKYFTRFLYLILDKIWVVRGEIISFPRNSSENLRRLFRRQGTMRCESFPFRICVFQVLKIFF
jgi:hypothetical protein